MIKVLKKNSRENYYGRNTIPAAFFSSDDCG
jgi:hypothetical protein